MTRLPRLLTTFMVLGALVAGAAAHAQGAGWDRKNADGKQFILRAPAGRLAEVAERHGLTVLDALSGDAGQEVALVEAPDTMNPDQVPDFLGADPNVRGLERAAIASLPDADLEQSTGFLVEQSTGFLVEALSQSGTFSNGSLEGLFAGPLWNGFANQPAAQLLRIHEAHAGAGSFGGGIVAVIDTGVDPNHPMLQGALVPGYDFIAEEAGIPSEWRNLDPAVAAELEQSTGFLVESATGELLSGDGAPYQLEQSTGFLVEQSTADLLAQYELPPTFGHGTAVAGLIRLVAPGARIMPLRTFDAEGTGSLYDIVRAIRFAVQNGAQVINMSFSTEAYSPELARAVNWAHRRGVICVAAAGNRSRRTMTYPAALGFSVGVASTDYEDALSAFSNYGSDLVSLAAPGEALITTFPGGSYAAVFGTSFSTPLVSGTIALLHPMLGNRANPSDYYKAAFALSRGSTFIPSLTSEIAMGRLDVAETVVTARD